MQTSSANRDKQGSCVERKTMSLHVRIMMIAAKKVMRRKIEINIVRERPLPATKCETESDITQRARTYLFIEVAEVGSVANMRRNSIFSSMRTRQFKSARKEISTLPYTPTGAGTRHRRQCVFWYLCDNDQCNYRTDYTHSKQLAPRVSLSTPTLIARVAARAITHRGIHI